MRSKGVSRIKLRSKRQHDRIASRVKKERKEKERTAENEKIRCERQREALTNFANIALSPLILYAIFNKLESTRESPAPINFLFSIIALHFVYILPRLAESTYRAAKINYKRSPLFLLQKMADGLNTATAHYEIGISCFESDDLEGALMSFKKIPKENELYDDAQRSIYYIQSTFLDNIEKESTSYDSEEYYLEQLKNSKLLLKVAEGITCSHQKLRFLERARLYCGEALRDNSTKKDAEELDQSIKEKLEATAPLAKTHYLPSLSC